MSYTVVFFSGLCDYPQTGVVLGHKMNGSLLVKVSKNLYSSLLGKVAKLVIMSDDSRKC